MKKNEKGFSAVEVLLVVVIIGLVGFVGWYVWHDRTGKNTTASTTTQQTNTNSEKGFAESTVSKAVTDFYDEYVKLDPLGNPPTQEALLKQYGTDNLLTYFKNNQNGVDPIVCAQTMPDSIKVTSSTINQKVATVVVEEMFGSDKISLTATVVDHNGLKIDGLKCANPLPAASSEGP